MLPHTLIYQAGNIALDIKKTGLEVSEKIDATVVTQADLAVSDFLTSEILNLYPDDQILSEEDIQPVDRTQRVWCIDPIDGTKNYIAGDATWSVMIGCVDAGVPIYGCIYYPVTGVMYEASKSEGCRKILGEEKTRCEMSGFSDMSQARIVTKKSITYSYHMKHRLDLVQCAGVTVAGPTGYICTELLDAKYDILMMGRGNIYELAAMDICIAEAGGALVTEDFRPVIYGNDNIHTKKGIWAMGRESMEKVV